MILVRSASRRGLIRCLVVTVGCALATTAPLGLPGAIGETARDEVRELLDGGHYAEAEALARQRLAEAEATSGADSLAAAKVIDRLVEALLRGGKSDDPETRALAERAVGIKERELGLEHHELAFSLGNLAILQHMRGDFEGARDTYRRELEILEKALGPEHEDVAVTLVNFSIALRDLGDYAAARPLLERSLAIYEKRLGLEHPRVAEALINLGQHFENIGDYAAARPLHERAVAIREMALGPEHPATAEAIEILASLLVHMGDFVTARALYERSLAIYERRLSPEHPSVAVALHNLAELLFQTGDLAAARRLHERALGILELRLGPEHPDTAAYLENLARDLESMGDAAGAGSLARRALAVRERALGGEHPHVARSLDQLAGLAAASGDVAAATALWDRALAIARKALGPQHPEIAVLLTHLGGALASAGDLEGSRSRLESAVRIREQALGPDHPLLAETLHVLARTLLRSGAQEEALAAALRAESVARDHVVLTARALAERQALAYAGARPLGLDPVLTLAARRLPPGSLRKVWDALVRSRAMVLDEMASRNRVLWRVDDPEVARLARDLTSARARFANLMTREPGESKPDIGRRLIDEARGAAESLERSLAARSAPYRRHIEHQRTGLDDVSAALPPDGALVACARYRREATSADDGAASGAATASGVAAAPAVAPAPHYVAFILPSRASDPLAVPLGPARDIDELAGLWQRQIARAREGAGGTGPAGEERYREVAAKLRRAIWDPLVPHLRTAGIVFVVPDGPLSLVNWATLPAGRGRYLLQTGPTLHYLSAERDLVARAEAIRTPRRLLALGGPDFEERPLAPVAAAGAVAPPGAGLSRPTYRGPLALCEDLRSLRFAALPGARAEAEMVASLFNPEEGSSAGGMDVMLLVGVEASEGRLKQQAPGRSVLHLATHGFFAGERCASALSVEARPRVGSTESAEQSTGENPLLLSGLALAGANHRGEIAEVEAEDGILTAEEVASLDLSAADWAVLSACGTGLGEVRTGEGVLGLRRAFQVAGARTLIMSLWEVDDSSARVWIGALYHSRLTGATTAEAVRRAGLDALRARQRAGVSTHPFFWGAFVAAGDWR